MKFTPAEIITAQYAFTARALHKTVKAYFHQWSTEILATRQFYYSMEYYTKTSRHLHRKLSPDRIITNPQHIHLMEGYGTEASTYFPFTDYYRFNMALRAKAVLHGFIHGEQAVTKAEDEMYQQESVFLAATEKLHKIPILLMPFVDNRKSIVDTLLRRFAFYVIPNIKKVQVAYCHNHIIADLAGT